MKEAKGLGGLWLLDSCFLILAPKGLFHDPFGAFEDGVGFDVDGFAGDGVFEDEGFLEDDGFGGDGVFDFGGFAGESGDEDLEDAGLGIDSGEEDDAIFGVIFALEDFAKDFVLGLEEGVVVEGLDFIEDVFGDVFEGGDDLAGVGEEFKFRGEEDVAAGVVGDGVAHEPVCFAFDDEAFGGEVLEVEFPTDGYDRGCGGGEEGVAGEAGESGECRERHD